MPSKDIEKRREQIYKSFDLETYFNGNIPSRVKICEVGPRDGLQHEETLVSVEAKVKLIEMLASAGLSHIEVGSFVSPKWVPQMANTLELFNHLHDINSTALTMSVLTPNMKGLSYAMDVQVPEVAIFAAASEEFSRRNINCSIEESLVKYSTVCSVALQQGIRVRGYVSCVLGKDLHSGCTAFIIYRLIGCPYEGEISNENVMRITRELLRMGCYEVSLGDTVGLGTPLTTHRLLRHLNDNSIPLERLAVHFHDTHSTAIPNILVALHHGVAVIDSSVSGLGGCPYADGATGNIATEDVVYLLDKLGIECGVSLSKLLEASRFIDALLRRQTAAKLISGNLGRTI